MKLLLTIALAAMLATGCADNAPQTPQTEPEQTEIKAVSYQLNINGMTCEHCAGRVKKILEEQPGVESAEVNHETGSAKVSVKAGTVIDEAAIREALDKNMYQLVALTTEG
jgi:P-type Cu2+ transporter